VRLGGLEVAGEDVVVTGGRGMAMAQQVLGAKSLDLWIKRNAGHAARIMVNWPISTPTLKASRLCQISV